MKIAMTGATGFIGRPLEARLRADGHDVRVLGRNPRGERDYSGLDRADALIHLAGEPVAAGRWTAERKRRIRDSRTVGTRELLDAATRVAAGSLRVFVCAGAVGYYGDAGGRALDESAPAGRDFLAGVCVDWEREALMAGELPSVRRVVLRTGIVLGRGGGAMARLLPVFRMGLGGRLGSGRQYFPWIHLDDMVGLYVHALTSSQMVGPVNAVAPEPVTQAEFARDLGSALRRPAVIPAPALALRLLLGEMADLLLGGQHVVPKRALEAGYIFRYPELAGALAGLKT